MRPPLSLLFKYTMAFVVVAAAAVLAVAEAGENQPPLFPPPVSQKKSYCLRLGFFYSRDPIKDDARFGG